MREKGTSLIALSENQLKENRLGDWRFIFLALKLPLLGNRVIAI